MSTISELEEAIKRGDTAMSLTIIKTMLEKGGRAAPSNNVLENRVKVLEDRVNGLAAVMAKANLRDPLDHDGDGRKGGSLPGRRKAKPTE